MNKDEKETLLVRFWNLPIMDRFLLVNCLLVMAIICNLVVSITKLVVIMAVCLIK